jgi:hypothetical protein
MSSQALQRLPDSPLDTFDARKESRKSLLGFSLVYLSGYFTDLPATFPSSAYPCARKRRREARPHPRLPWFRQIHVRLARASVVGGIGVPGEIPVHPPHNRFQPPGNAEHRGHQNRAGNELPHQAGLRRDQGHGHRGLFAEGRGFRISNGVRILARSRGQKVRGLRHLQYRPRLVVVDDPEDGEWIRTKENRDKTARWLHSEVMGGLDARKGKLVVIGNQLHMDALL